MTDSWGVGPVTRGLLTEAAQVLIDEANQEKQELHDAIVRQYVAVLRTGQSTPTSDLSDQITEYRDKARVIDRRIRDLSSLLDTDDAEVQRQVVTTQA